MPDDVLLNAGSGGDTIAADLIGAVKHQRVKIEFGGDNTATEVSLTNRLPVDPNAVQSLQRNRGTLVAIAAGGSGDIDSAQITAAKTGQLLQLVVSSSVFFKIDLKTVTNAIESAVLHTEFGGPLDKVDFKPVHKAAFAVAQDAGAGLDAFRVTVTNLDTGEAADFYATWIYDEV